MRFVLPFGWRNEDRLFTGQPVESHGAGAVRGLGAPRNPRATIAHDPAHVCALPLLQGDEKFEASRYDASVQEVDGKGEMGPKPRGSVEYFRDTYAEHPADRKNIRYAAALPCVA